MSHASQQTKIITTLNICQSSKQSSTLVYGNNLFVVWVIRGGRRRLLFDTRNRFSVCVCFYLSHKVSFFFCHVDCCCYLLNLVIFRQLSIFILLNYQHRLGIISIELRVVEEGRKTGNHIKPICIILSIPVQCC